MSICDKEILEEIHDNQIRLGLSERQCAYSWFHYTPVEGQEMAFEYVYNFMRSFIYNAHNGKGLLLVGGVGSGKTLLSCCVVTQIAKGFAKNLRGERVFCSCRDYHNIDKSVIFINPLEMFRKLKGEYGETNVYYLRELQEVELLIIDDLGIEKSSEWTKEKLYEIIDYRYNNSLPMFITTNCIPKELKEKIGDRCFDRLREMCTLVSVTTQSQRETSISYKELD